MQPFQTATDPAESQFAAALAPFPVTVEVPDLASRGALDPRAIEALARRAIAGASPEATDRVLRSLGERRPDLDYGNYALEISFTRAAVLVLCEGEPLLYERTDGGR